MLKKILLSGVLLTHLATTAAFAQRVCGTPSVDQLPASQQAVLQQIEQHTQRFIAQQVTNPTNNRTAATLYTIPVVVHVVYNTAAQNISDAMIQSQLDVLNADYARTNADAGNTPAAFQGVAADFQIRFVLATRDPSGNATTGIVRKSTTKTYFEYGGADTNGVFVKQSAKGGADGWNPSQYLNMWVCNFGGASSDLLGYATFPDEAGTYKDGVVMGYKYFGVNPSVGGVFGYGRTATHEVGHWLNLRHIWGDANCGNDLVSDTPTQQTSNGGCPSFPKKTCGNTTNGDMFMNYMDYTNDQCMNTFTNGQKARAHALFTTGGVRVSLLTSPGLGAGTPATCSVPAGLGSSALTSTSATVTWTAVTGAASYNVQYKTSAASTWTTTTSTTASKGLTGLAAATGYQFKVQTVCSGGSSAYSSPATFTTPATTAPGYCAANGTNVSYEFIDKVALGSINRTSGADAGYYNGTALNTSLARGSSQTLTYSAGFASSAYTEFWNVWIDFNGDKDFLDAGEQVVTNRSSNLATDLTSTFTVPATAVLGATRMRVSVRDASGQASCGSYTYGEVEDYTVTIAASGGGTTPPPAATYCASKGTSVAYEYIDKVKLGSINRTSGADAGYYNGTALSTGLPLGSNQTLTYSAGFVGTAYTEFWNVWIDFNRDGDFLDAGEQVVTNRSSNLATDLTSTFTVPASASVGMSRMRVSMRDASGQASCGTFSYGEVEDYAVNLGSASARREGAEPSFSGLAVYPNPADRTTPAKVQFTLATRSEVTLRVRDLSGRLVFEQVLADAAGSTELALPTLPAGLYLVGVRTADAAEQVTRLVVAE